MFYVFFLFSFQVGATQSPAYGYQLLRNEVQLRMMMN